MPPNSHNRAITTHQGGGGGGGGKAASSTSKRTKKTRTPQNPRDAAATTASPSSTNPHHHSHSSKSDADDPPRQHREQQPQEENSYSVPPPDEEFRSIESYIPPELRDVVHPYHGDFCYSFHFHPHLVAQLMAEGFLPIATVVGIGGSSSSSTTRRNPNSYVLLPKLHEQRCVVPLHPGAVLGTTATAAAAGAAAAATTAAVNTASTLHVSKSVRKRSSRYCITSNVAWNEVVEACQVQHGNSSWLYPPLVQALTDLHRQSLGMGGGRDSAGASRNNAPPTAVIRNGSSRANPYQDTIRVPVRLYSIEVWREHDDDEEGPKTKDDERRESEGTAREHRAVPASPRRNTEKSRHRGPSSLPPFSPRRTLVAGELGYTVGAVYTSLTGFTRESGAGTVQLAALGRWLQRSGFHLWDLGMEMEYKFELGAVLVPRHQFVRAVRELRLPPYNHLVLRSSPCSGPGDDAVGGMNCRDVIDNKS